MQAGVGQVIKTMLEVMESGGETTRTLSVVSPLMDWLQLLIIAVIIRFRELFGQQWMQPGRWTFLSLW